MVRRFELWSVAKVAFLFHLCCGFLSLIVCVGVWLAADRIGTRDRIESFLGDLLGTENFHWATGTWSAAANQIVGSWLGQFTSAMGMISAIGLYSALVLVYSRVPFVMGQDGYLPKALMKTNRWDAPWVSLIVSGTLYTVVILVFRNLEELASAAVTVYAAMMSLELLSFLVLRWREPTLPRPFRVPGGWCVAVVLCILPLLCIGTGAYYCVQEDGLWKVVGLAIAIMASGPVLYPVAAWWRRKHWRSVA